MAVSGPYRSSFDEILILDLYNLVLYKLNCIRKYLNKIKNNLTLPLINCYSKNKDILSLEYKANLIYSLKTKNINESIKNELNKPIKKQ